MNKGSLIVSFLAGAAFGSLAGILATKTYFKETATARANEDIESVKEYYRKKDESREAVTNQQIEKRAYEIIAEKYAVSDDKDISKKKEEGVEAVMEKRPYVIEPEEFGDLDYEEVSLNYYDDGVLTYEDDTVIENVDELVGRESLSRFGEFEADTVYVRNDELETDFEIMADTKKYSDIYC